MITPENFLHTGGCFKHNTSRVQVLGWLEKKEEEKRKTIPSFDCFRLATLEEFLYTTYITATVDWGSLYKLF